MTGQIVQATSKGEKSQNVSCALGKWEKVLFGKLFVMIKKGRLIGSS